MSTVENDAIREARLKKQIVIWLQDTKTKSATGEPVYILRSHSPFEHLFSMQKRNENLDAEFFGDVLNGYRFCSTMQLRTPTNILKSHGRLEKTVPRKLPKIVKSDWQGLWVPEAKTLREIGVDVDEMPRGTMASEIGQIPSDGGDFLRFMLFSHHIKNEKITYEQKLRWFEIGYFIVGQDGQPFSEIMGRYGDNVREMASRIMYLSRDS